MINSVAAMDNTRPPSGVSRAWNKGIISWDKPNLPDWEISTFKFGMSKYYAKNLRNMDISEVAHFLREVVDWDDQLICIPKPTLIWDEKSRTFMVGNALGNFEVDRTKDSYSEDILLRGQRKILVGFLEGKMFNRFTGLEIDLTNL